MEYNILRRSKMSYKIAVLNAILVILSSVPLIVMAQEFMSGNKQVLEMILAFLTLLIGMFITIVINGMAHAIMSVSNVE